MADSGAENSFCVRYACLGRGASDFFFFSSRRRHTRSDRDWSSDVCSSDLGGLQFGLAADDGKVFFGTTNSRNAGRNIGTRYVSNESFLDINGFTALGLKTGDRKSVV